MATKKTRDLRVQTLVLAGIPILDGGDTGNSATIELAARSTVTRGVSTTIESRTSNPDDYLSITTYEEDAAHRTMLALYNRWRANDPTLVLFGEAFNLNTGTGVAWADGGFTDIANFVRSQDPTTSEWRLYLHAAERVG